MDLPKSFTALCGGRSRPTHWVGLAAAMLLTVAAGLVLFLWLGQSVRLLSVASGSMSPLIRKGDAVVVRHGNPVDIQVGDIVSYSSPQDSAVIITHRVVQVFPETGRLVTRGDANSQPDPAIHASRVLGTVQYTLASGGRIVNVLHTWPGLVLTIYLPMAVILGREFIRLARFYLWPTYTRRGYLQKV